jgi:hypothetical protein
MSKHSSTNDQVENKVAHSQTDTGAPNDQRAAATQTHGSPTPDASRSTAQGPRTDATANMSRASSEASQRSDTGLSARSPAAPYEAGEHDAADHASRSRGDAYGVTTTAQGNDHTEGKKTFDETPTVETADVLAHTAPGTPLAARNARSAPVLHAPTVTPKGKLGYMATPSLPENGIAPGVNPSGPAKADYFTKPIVDTSITKPGSPDDKRDTANRSR